jgi:hypothetical protein
MCSTAAQSAQTTARANQKFEFDLEGARRGSVHQKNATAPASESGGYNAGYNGKVRGLLHRYGFGQVAGLVYVAAAADGDVIGQKLQRDDFE